MSFTQSTPVALTHCQALTSVFHFPLKRLDVWIRAGFRPNSRFDLFILTFLKKVIYSVFLLRCQPSWFPESRFCLVIVDLTSRWPIALWPDRSLGAFVLASVILAGQHVGVSGDFRRSTSSS